MTESTASTSLPATLGTTFAFEYDRCRRRVHELAEGLTEDQFWTKPFPFGNSFGHLVLHLTGNLSYYIGSQVASTGFVRTRDREFTDPARRPKADVMGAFDETVDMVRSTLAAQQQASDWTATYFGEREPDAHTRFHIFLNCAMHFYHHIGQMIYLTAALAPERR